MEDFHRGKVSSQGLLSYTLKMEAAWISKTSVSCHTTTSITAWKTLDISGTTFFLGIFSETENGV
jgi:hypothetical protein